MNIKKIVALVLATVMVFAMAACGSSAPKAAASDTPSIDAIKEKGKLVVMTASGFPPFEYIDASGAVTGVDLELAKLIADEIGVDLEIVDMNFDLLIDSLKSGKGDLVAAGMTATAARAEIIDFSTIYISLGLKVVVPANSIVNSFDDIDGKKIAVQESTTADIFAQEHYKNAEILGFKTAIDACNAVKSGNVDCAIVDMLPAEYMTSNSPDINLLEGLVSAEETAMAVAKGHEDLLAVVNKVLEKAMTDGTLDELFNKHMENFAL